MFWKIRLRHNVEVRGAARGGVKRRVAAFSASPRLPGWAARQQKMARYVTNTAATRAQEALPQRHGECRARKGFCYTSACKKGMTYCINITTPETTITYQSPRTSGTLWRERRELKPEPKTNHRNAPPTKNEIAACGTAIG